MIRLAHTDEEKNNIFRFRYAIYYQERGVHLEGIDHQKKWIHEAHDYSSFHFFAEGPEGVIATLTLTLANDYSFPERWKKYFCMEKWKMFSSRQLCTSSRLAIHQKYRGSLITFRIMQSAFQFGCRNKLMVNFVHASDRWSKIYAKLGYRQCAPKFMSASGQQQTPMALMCFDLGWLTRCRSPLLKCVQSLPELPHRIRAPDEIFAAYNDLKKVT